MTLEGRRAIITGSNQGLGLVMAEHFVRAGAHVALCARNAERLEAAREQVATAAPAGVRVLARPCDVTDETALRGLVDEVVVELGGVDVLACSAGVYGTKGLVEEIDLEEWRQCLDVNLVGVLTSCRAVIPHMKERGAGKILILSGGGATKPMPYLSAYAASKAGVVRLAETIAGEVAPHGIDVNTIAPGALNTRLLDEILEAGPERVGQSFYEASVRQQDSGGDSLDRAAELCVYLASTESDGVTGRLISAKWDPWETLHEHHSDLDGSDVYTLRRIVPAERDMDWGERT